MHSAIQKIREKIEREIEILQGKLDLLNDIEGEIEKDGPKVKNTHGGYRGGGRPKGSRNKKDIEAEMRKKDLKAMRKHKKSILSDDVNESLEESEDE